MKQYRKRRDQKIRAKAFLDGFRALQADLMETFQRMGKGETSGFTALEIVKNSQPEVPRET
jgi:hypothetical protein